MGADAYTSKGAWATQTLNGNLVMEMRLMGTQRTAKSDVQQRNPRLPIDWRRFAWGPCSRRVTRDWRRGAH